MTARTRGYRIRAGDRGYQVRAGDPGGRAGAGARGERVRAGTRGGQLRAEPCVDRVDGGPDRGAASILLLAVGLVVVLAGLGGAAIGTARVARHQAQNAADLAALAGATDAVFGEVVACARAADFAVANGARLTSCTVDGLEIVVRAEVTVRPLPGVLRQAGASARAGPVSGPVG